MWITFPTFFWVFLHSSKAPRTHIIIDERYEKFKSYFEVPLLEFHTRLGRQDPFHDLLEGHSLVEEMIHPGDDRRPNTELLGQLVCALGVQDALRHHPHVSGDFLDVQSLPELESDVAVAAEVTRAGEDEVADPGQAEKGRGIRS